MIRLKQFNCAMTIAKTDLKTFSNSLKVMLNLGGFRKKQTQMYVCTLVEFILIDIASLPYNWILKNIGKYTGLHTLIIIHAKVS